MKQTTTARYNRDEILKSIKTNGTYSADVTPSTNFLKVTEDTGYKPPQAINDIIDNSLDAGADSVWVSIGQENNKPYVTISDNGSGMPVETLVGAMVLGASDAELQSKNKSSEGVTQGRFGTGWKTSIATFRGKAVIYSKVKGEDIYKITYDIDDMISRNSFTTPIEIPTESEVEFFNEETDNSKSGTITKITDINKFDMTAITSQKSSIVKSIAQTFRRFISNNKCKLFVNKSLIKPIDPMSYHTPVVDGNITYKSEIFNEIEYNDLKYFDSNGEEKRNGWAKLTFYKLPVADGGIAEESGWSSSKSGFYILRNNREIMEAQTLGLYGRVTVYSRLRVEMEFTSEIDSITNPNYLKTLFNFPRYFLDRITPDVKSEFNRFRAVHKKENPSKKQTTQQKNYNNRFINHMRKIKGLLPTLPNLTPTISPPLGNSTGRKNKSYNPQDNISIDYYSGGEYGKVWEGSLLNSGSKKVELLINEDHSLNTQFMTKGDDKLMGVVTSMMAALTISKWTNIPDGKASDEYEEKWNQIEAQFGMVLKQILDGVPQ
jgi:hypothetical protein